jgi:hypothetical protein
MEMYHEKGMDIKETRTSTVVITPFAERRAHKANAEMEELSPHFFGGTRSTLSK